MTNGDKLRELYSNDMIAQEFCIFFTDCDVCPLDGNEHCTDYEVRMKWLERETENEQER